MKGPISIEDKKIKELNKKLLLKKRVVKVKDKEKKPEDVKVTPYREIVFSDGAGFFIKTACNLTRDNRVQVLQYREHADADGMKFQSTEPTYFETKKEFLEWLLESLRVHFDDIPYVTIKPVKASDMKKQERDTIDTMYG